MCNKVFEEAAKRDEEVKAKESKAKESKAKESKAKAKVKDEAKENKEEEEMAKKQEGVNETLIVSPLNEGKDAKVETEVEEEFVEPEISDDVEDEEVCDREPYIEEEESAPVGDRLIVTPMGQEPTIDKKDVVSNQVVSSTTDPVDAIEVAIEESGIKHKLTDSEEEVVDNFIKNAKVSESTNGNAQPKRRENAENTESAEQSVTEMAVGVLSKFKDYIKSDKFDESCEKAAKKHGVKKQIVKNKMVAGFLGTIADTLGLTIAIGGDIILGAVGFISSIIEKIVTFAVDSLMKLITVLTLNCGTVKA